MSKDDIRDCCNHLNIARPTYYRHFKKLQDLNWIIESKYKYRFIGNPILRYLCDVDTKATIVFNINDLQQSYARWTAFCLAAFQDQQITANNKYKRYQARTGKVRSSCHKRDKSRINLHSGRFALSLFNAKLNISTTYASKMRKLGSEMGLFEIYEDFDREYGLILIKDIVSFKRAYPEIAHKIRIGVFHSVRTAYVLGTPIVINRLIDLKYRGNLNSISPLSKSLTSYKASGIGCQTPNSTCKQYLPK